MTERWLPVPGYEGLYEVSDEGRVRSLDKINARGRRWKGRILTPAYMPRGYRTVSMWRDGKQKTALVHRLVLFAFAGPQPDGMEALHGNGNPNDNRAVNLRWGTHSENQRDQIAHGNHVHASRTHCNNGHEFTPENTYLYPNQRHRACRICKAKAQRLWHERNPERSRALRAAAQKRYHDRKKAA